ncbi:cell division protein FtsH [Candidatus Uhrbacteria bacterium CG10_big_fil_rev_8_21_14_0_10_48_11]|uniref:ATP-dependent zinc metalloprotease FtsH n=1 Tax=Candidatus Uhrbacteria bacterium CG10_big_fil_rev_8_21_14_0_10_48_11 TaxID=1975037 RepID=A0A2M8LE55_9BACT|nr:MAG: cell division protein FtsH [Candidatus Uhrbacteria bacterium CG10_big_fil_rev_8_21_14_0_10_48_11]
MRNLIKNFLLFTLLFFAIAGAVSTFSSLNQKPTEVGLEAFVAAVETSKVQSVSIKDDTTITFTLTDGTKEVSYKEPTESLPTLLIHYGIDPEVVRRLPITVEQQGGLSFWLTTILPFLLPFLLIGVLIYFMMRQVQGMNNKAMMFGQSGAREFGDQRRETTTFRDIAGATEAKIELEEVVEFLKEPTKFQAMGAKIPRGVLLMGAPGTGKTLLARAVAGEAGVPFFHISGSEFVEMFVGVGASRVRDLFRRAKKVSPAIIFIDEIDAVGRQRGSGLGGSHDEREQTLNQILVEMDGFEPSTNVIVMAATNRPDVLDAALLRPGRFDRRVTIDLPDINDREAILKIHARKKPISPEVSLRAIAERTPGLAGADLANVMNEAAIFATRQGKKIIDQRDLLESVEKVILGPERRSRVISDKEKKITAYHEAGHALVAHLLPNADPVHKISIVSRGHAAGYTLKLPTEDRNFHTKSEFIDDLAVMLGGYTVEQEVLGELTTGASNDLQQATKLVRRLIKEYGMSELGPRTFGQKEELIFLGREIHEQRDYSEKAAEHIDEEVAAFLQRAQATAKRLVKQHTASLERIVAALLKKEVLERQEFEAIMSAV